MIDKKTSNEILEEIMDRLDYCSTDTDDDIGYNAIYKIEIINFIDDDVAVSIRMCMN